MCRCLQNKIDVIPFNGSFCPFILNTDCEDGMCLERLWCAMCLHCFFRDNKSISPFLLNSHSNWNSNDDGYGNGNGNGGKTHSEQSVVFHLHSKHVSIDTHTWVLSCDFFNDHLAYCSSMAELENIIGNEETRRAKKIVWGSIFIANSNQQQRIEKTK